MIRRRKPLARGKPPKRTRLKRGLGRVGKLRADGNAEARAFYFKTHGTEIVDDQVCAYCQACRRQLPTKVFTAHHKLKDGEDLSNKLALCKDCHLSYVHERTRTDRRKFLESVETSVVTGGFIDWQDLAADFAAFLNFKTGGQHGQQDQGAA